MAKQVLSDAPKPIQRSRTLPTYDRAPVSASTTEKEASEIWDAIRRGREYFKLCPNRVWSVASSLPGREKNLPSLIPLINPGLSGDNTTPAREQREDYNSKDHDQCTYDFCEQSRRDFTNVPQRHERSLCVGKARCEEECYYFNREMLVEAATSGSPTAWKLDRKGFVRSPEPYMAISHVWSDGTGAGNWEYGYVNKCLYRFWRGIAEYFHCVGVWWDAVCIPQEKAARTKAIAKIQDNYEDARITLVHDGFLRDWEWNGDPENAAFAIVMSPWFSRGWTSLELAKSRKVKVIFRNVGGEYVIKDLDEDILAKTDGTAARAIANLRQNKGIADINSLVSILRPRNTSWPRDFAVISGLLAGVGINASQQGIYQRILRKIGQISHGHLFHNSVTMSPSGGFGWCSTSLLDLPLMSADDGADDCVLQVEKTGAIVGLWKAIPIDTIEESNYVWGNTHPLIEIALRLALTKQRDRHTLLVEPHARSVSRAIVARVIRKRIAKEVVCEFLGPVYFHLPHTLSSRWIEINIRIGGTAKVEETERGAWAELIAQVTTDEQAEDAEAAAKNEIPRPGFMHELSKNKALLRAAADGDVDAVWRLVQDGADLDCQDILTSWTPLHCASWRNHIAVVDLLVEKANTRIRDRFGQQAIHLAAERGNSDTFTLLCKDADLNSCCRDGQTVLHRAAYSGSSSVVDLLLERPDSNVDVHAADVAGNTALHIAADQGHRRTVEQLLRAGADPNARNAFRRIPLHAAITYGHEEVVGLLLPISELDARDHKGRSAFYLAAMKPQTSVIYQMLLLASHELRYQGGKTPLHWAVESWRSKILRLQLPHSDPSVRDADGRTPLLLAAMQGFKQAVELLLEKDALHIDVADLEGKTPLSAAVEYGNFAVAKMLVESGAQISNEDVSCRVLLLWAAEEGDHAVSQLLLEGGIDPNDGFGTESPLLLSVKHGHEGVASLLLQHKADAEATDYAGRTPLVLAAEKGCTGIVKLLVDVYGADPNRKTRYGSTPLYYAAEGGHDAIVELLLDTERVNVNVINLSIGRSPLLAAARAGHFSIVDKLLRVDGINVNLEGTYDHETPLAAAARRGHTSVFELLLRNGGSTNGPLFERGSSGIYPSSRAKRKRKVSDPIVWESTLRFIVKMQVGRHADASRLLESGDINFNLQYKGGFAALHAAVGTGRHDMVWLVLDAGGVDVDLTTNKGNTPLGLAVQKKNKVGIAKILLEDGKADVNLQNNKGNSPLHLATRMSNSGAVGLLLHDPKVNANLKNYDGDTAFTVAVQRKNNDVVRLLLASNKVNANLKNRNGDTPLSLAVQGTNTEMVKLLLESSKVSANLKNRNGDTPLSLAVQGTNTEVVKLLLESSKVNTNLRDDNGYAPLSLAILRGHTAMVGLLLHHDKIDVSVLDSQDRSPLSLAAEKGYAAVVQILLRKDDLNINLQDAHGNTPLWWAISGGSKAAAEAAKEVNKARKANADPQSNKDEATVIAAVQVAELLLNTGKANVNLPNRKGETPLFLAAHAAGELGVMMVHLLLDMININVNVRNKRGETPLMEAAKQGNTEVVELLLGSSMVVNVNARSTAGDTPLSLAQKGKHEKIVQMLLETGQIDEALYPTFVED